MRQVTSRGIETSVVAEGGVFKIEKMKLCIFVIFFGFFLSYSCAAPSETSPKDSEDVRDSIEETGRELIEQGRTFVHHAVKRFMIILPAIFFKLGIAFTLLLVVTLVAVNNGFIGFLLLVVGMSSVLARLQQAQRPPVVPIYQSVPSAYHHAWDRSDSADPQVTKGSQDGQSQQYSPYVGYYSRYVTNSS